MLNYAVLQGRLVRDPESRTTQSGVSVCSFTVAWSDKYKETETKLFLNCTAWRGTADMVSRYFSKGKEIIVEGKLSTREWQDKEGNKRSAVEMTVGRVNFCGPKQAEGSNSIPAQANYSAPSASEGQFSELTDEDGDLPF